MHDVKQFQTSKVDETAKSPRRGREEQAVTLNTQIHKPRSTEVERESETTTEVAAQKAVEGCKGERVSKKHQQQGNDAHNMDGTKKKIETCEAASTKSEATEKHEI